MCYNYPWSPLVRITNGFSYKGAFGPVMKTYITIRLGEAQTLYYIVNYSYNYIR